MPMSDRLHMRGHVICLGGTLGVCSFQSSPGSSNVQPWLKTTALEDSRLKEIDGAAHI